MKGRDPEEERGEGDRVEGQDPKAMDMEGELEQGQDGRVNVFRD